jgi:hypothetical protein
MEKITIREHLEGLKVMFEGGEYPFTAEQGIEFCEKELAKLDKKAVKAKERAAEKGAANDELSTVIEEALTDEFQTIGEITATLLETHPDLTVSKVQYRLSKLAENGKAEKGEVTIPPVAEGGKSRKAVAYKK